MGLKWFRARLRMNRVPKNTTSVAGFYRSMSQFDSDVQLPQTTVSEVNNAIHSIHSVPTLPSPIAYNPMAALNNRDNETPEVPSDIVSRPSRHWEVGNDSQRSSNEEPESSEDVARISRHLPRESIELIRGGSTEASPRQLVARSKKIDFKKKKGKAPIPKTTNSSNEDDGKFVKIDKGRGSDASEIEI